MPVLKVVLLSLLVALLAEGVDRNKLYYICTMDDESRPPRGGRG